MLAMENSSATSSTNNTSNDAATATVDPLETAKWTRYLPEAFGIREAVQNSSYRWCAREGGMWGIATATAMGLHRWRMGSKPIYVGHSVFGTLVVVMFPSYYLCYRRRDHHEQVIEAMMKYNQFGHAATDLPAEPPIQEHPFWEETKYNTHSNDTIKHDREYRGMIKEQKEWQKKSEPSFDEIFKEKK